jgi:hypothetical protein
VTTVTCSATDDGGNTRPRSFTVTVVADPAATVPVANAGATVAVVAEGFAPNSWAYVRFQSDPIPVGMFQADAQGRIEITLTVPDGLPPGEHDVIVEGFAPDGSVRQFVQPIVVADPSLPPTTEVPATVPPTTSPAPTGLTPFLPGTGSDSMRTVLASLLVILVGGLALAVGRSRRGGTSSTRQEQR